MVISTLRSAIVGLLGLSVFCSPASAELRLDEGMWRLGLNNDFGVHQGSRNRSGDYSVNAVVEYEVPATSRATLGLRMMPLFVYAQHDNREYRYWSRKYREHEDDDTRTVWGAGIGLGGRIYQIKDEYRGWFADLGVTALIHENKFSGNSSNLNFVSALGVGYQFKSDWHVQLHYQHISNASLGDRNSGANSLGLGVGYRF